MTLVPRRSKRKMLEGGMVYSTDAVLLKVGRNHDFRLRGKLPEGVTRELGRIIENLIQQHAGQKTNKQTNKTRQDKTTENDELVFVCSISVL